MKAGKAIQLALALYGAWSLLQGIVFYRVTDEYQCSSNDTLGSESVRRKLLVAPPPHLMQGASLERLGQSERFVF